MNRVFIGLNIGLSKIQQYVAVFMSRGLKTFVTTRKDRYALICGLKEYDKMHENSSDAVISDGKRLLTDDSTTYTIELLCCRINCIYTWVKLLDYIYIKKISEKHS